MGAFILAGIVFVGTLLLALLQVLGAGMSDAPGSGDGGAGWTLGIGLTLSALIAASHWMPHIGW